MKKIISIILIITTLFILGSCAAAGPENKNTSNETTSTKSEETTASEYKQPSVNYNNAPITIAAVDHLQSGTVVTWTVEAYSDAYAPEQNGDPINDALYFRNQRVEEELGVTIKTIPLGYLVTCGDNLKKLILAADAVIDIAFMSGSFISTFVGTDMVLDLKSIPNVDFSHSWWDQHCVKEFDLFGTMAIVTGDISLNSNFAQIIYFFNKQLANEFQLDNMYDLVRKGNWTIPKMMEMCRTVAHDVNGDGVMGVEDCFGLMTEMGHLPTSIISGGVRLTEKDNDGVPQIAVNTQRTADLVEMLVPFMRDKDINIYSSDYSGKYKNAFRELMVPMFIDNRSLFFNNQLLVGMEFRSMDGDFGILPAPKYDSAQENYYSNLSGYWATYIMAPTTNGNFEMTGHVLESMGYYSQQYVTPAYIDTTVMNKTLRDDESAEMMYIIFGNRYYDLGYMYNWGGILNLFYTLIDTKKVTFASEFAKIETKIQKEIDKTVEMLR